MTRLSPRRPVLEALESRWCPTAVSFVNGTLTLTGDDTANTVSLRPDDANNTLRLDYDVTIGGTKFLLTTSFASDAVKEVQVDLKGGSDTFIYKLDSDATPARSLFVDLGYGDDKATLNLTGGAVKADLYFVLVGDPVSFDPNQPPHGSDTLQADVGVVDSAKLSLFAALGGGANDVATVNLYGDLKGTADVAVSLFGSDGHDLLQVTAIGVSARGGYTGVDIDPQARLSVWLDGDGGADQLAFKYYGKNEGLLSRHVYAGGDAGDSATISVLQKAGSTGQVYVD